jgi:DNA-binding NarL/FixJ family response regulator
MHLLIIDDHEVVREGLIATLAADRRNTIVATTSTPAEAIRLDSRAAPDVALVDLRLADMRGERLCEQLLAIVP